MSYAALTLANISLDLQITICTHLHPSDILSLRATCKALERSTRYHAVWKAAVRRICADNDLFLPSFPTSDMNPVELEKTARSPRRWKDFCRRLEKRRLNDPIGLLRPPFREISHPIIDNLRPCRFFFVPGGRYLVIYSRRTPPGNIYVLDLGYNSSTDCALISSAVVPVVEATGWLGAMNWADLRFSVLPTPDGMGLNIFYSYVSTSCNVYELYPRSETPHMRDIAHLDYNLTSLFASELDMIQGSSNVVWYSMFGSWMALRVWDYRSNCSRGFHVDFEWYILQPKVIATNTAIIVLFERRMLIWAIPDLLPGPPDFNDYSPWLNPDHTMYIPTLFNIPIPFSGDLFVVERRIMAPWYFGSSNPLYFETLRHDSKVDTFRIMLKPDLTSATVQFVHSINRLRNDDEFDTTSDEYRLCEDSIFSCRIYDNYPLHGWSRGRNLLAEGFEPYRCFAVSNGGPAGEVILPHVWHSTDGISSCPASGRFVASLSLDGDERLIFFDFNDVYQA